MQIPYEVAARRDTGLYNAKLGIWLFLASEVMLFGGLFSAYVFLRLGAPEGTWPHGQLDVLPGFINTMVLIGSSITVLLAWTALKLRQYGKYLIYMGITILCSFAFMGIKAYEYNGKFHHFGAFIHAKAIPQYAEALVQSHARIVYHPISRTYEVTGHLENSQVLENITLLEDLAKVEPNPEEKNRLKKEISEQQLILAVDQEAHSANKHTNNPLRELIGEIRFEELRMQQDYAVQLEEGTSTDTSLLNHNTHHGVTLRQGDLWRSGFFYPSYNAFFAIYFTLTGLHALHVILGALVLTYFFLFGYRIYRKNPEHQANRVEVGGLFWHFVDLVWIFLFPILYLL